MHYRTMYRVELRQGDNTWEFHTTRKPNSADSLQSMVGHELRNLGTLRDSYRDDAESEHLADGVTRQIAQLVTLQKVAGLWEGETVIKVGDCIVGSVILSSYEYLTEPVL